MVLWRLDAGKLHYVVLRYRTYPALLRSHASRLDCVAAGGLCVAFKRTLRLKPEVFRHKETPHFVRGGGHFPPIDPHPEPTPLYIDTPASVELDA